MRISSITAHALSADIPPEHQVYSGAGLKTSREAVVLEIESDDGLIGVGTIGAGSARVLHAAVSLVEELFAPSLLGRDPRAIEDIWNALYYEVVLRQLGPRGIGVAILSGIDIALWDLAGRRLGVPVYELLGGPREQPVAVYASGVYEPEPAAAAARARTFVDAGHTALKVKVGYLPLDVEVQRLEAVREAVGPAVELMADANMGFTRFTALELGRQLQRLGFVFFEEPIPIDDIDGHAWLQDRLDLRIATGENLATRWAFLPFLRSGGVAVVQPEASKTGGITESRRIIAEATTWHAVAAPHALGNAITLAVAAQLCAANPACVTLELEELVNPLTRDLATGLPRRTGDVIEMPSAPGLGIELDRDWMSDHAYTSDGAIMRGGRPRTGLSGAVL